MRKKCGDCPYKKNDKKNAYRNKKWIEMVSQNDYTKNRDHTCHCIDNDTWGSKNPITKKNVCIGRKEYLETQK